MSKNDEGQLFRALSSEALNSLFVDARRAMEKAHCIYSKFPVGAALRTSDGNIYCGANIESVSYPEGWCAETTALSHFVMAGGGQICDVVVVAQKMDSITPCGGCRQRLAEFCNAQTRIHLCDQNGVVKTILMQDLLPHAFETELLS